eukprot:g1024.t1
MAESSLMVDKIYRKHSHFAKRRQYIHDNFEAAMRDQKFEELKDIAQDLGAKSLIYEDVSAQTSKQGFSMTAIIFSSRSSTNEEINGETTFDRPDPSTDLKPARDLFNDRVFLGEEPSWRAIIERRTRDLKKDQLGRQLAMPISKVRGVRSDKVSLSHKAGQTNQVAVNALEHELEANYHRLASKTHTLKIDFYTASDFIGDAVSEETMLLESLGLAGGSA